MKKPLVFIAIVFLAVGLRCGTFNSIVIWDAKSTTYFLIISKDLQICLKNFSVSMRR